MNNLDFIYKRHSVRKFKDVEIPMEDIQEVIKAATYAPSGKNLQNWHFVILRNKEKIEEMVGIVENKNAELSSYTSDKEKSNAFKKYVKYHTVFRNAPIVILVYAGPYPATGIEFLQEKGVSDSIIHDFLRPSPGIQNIGAAMENLQLAAASMGYGTCWMTGPNYAAKEIEEFIGFKKPGYFLAAMTPFGVPQDIEYVHPPRKPVEEVMTVID
ncbi:nitroreductase family protein [Brassicibacter mesophilus]|uniref:nitroreductase family protein n=1 Tax=Brassicibacter mesophilus TaxID=745119 RepID=UPI003D1EE444